MITEHRRGEITHAPRAGPPRRITSKDVWTVLWNALAVVALLLLLWRLRTLVSWFLVALLLTLAVRPAVTWMTRHRIRRGVAVLLLFLAISAISATLIATLAPLLVEQARELAARGPDLVHKITATEPVAWLDRRLDIIEQARGAVHTQGTDIASSAFAFAGKLVQGVVGAVTIVVLMVFMLLFGDEVTAQALAWVSPDTRAHWQDLGRRMRSVVGGYVAGVFLVATIGGIVMAITTLILGVPYFLALGLVMVVLGIVPYLGSALGAVLVVGTTFTASGLKAGAIALVVYLIYQQVENELLHPLVQRHTIQMNPLLITLALLAGTMLAGVLGTLLALPLAGALQVLLEDTLQRRRAGWAREEGAQRGRIIVLTGHAGEES